MLGLLGQGNGGLFVAHADLEIRSAGADRQVPIAQPADEIERLSRWLLARQPQRIGRHRRLDHRPHLHRRAEETIRRRQPFEPLVRALEVVVLDEEADPSLAIVEVSKDGPGQKLLPHRLPETLDLPAGLWMVRPALHVRDAVAPKLLLEIGRAAPSRVLPTLVGQDLPRRTVVGNPARQRFHHQRAALVMRHRQAHQVARVIVQKRRDVHPLVLAQQESEEIGLPELVWLRPLEAMLLGLGFRFGRLALLRQPLGVQHTPHRRLGSADPEETPHHVPHAPAAGIRLRRLHVHDRVSARVGRLLPCPRRPLGPGLKRFCTAVPVALHPGQCRRVWHAKLPRRRLYAELLLDHCLGQGQPDVRGPPVCTRAVPAACLAFRLHLSPPESTLRQSIRRESAR
jgi:hypothetical protein